MGVPSFLVGGRNVAPSGRTTPAPLLPPKGSELGLKKRSYSFAEFCERRCRRKLRLPLYLPGQARSAKIRDPGRAHRCWSIPRRLGAHLWILAPGSRICTAFGGLSGKVGKGAPLSAAHAHRPDLY